MSPRERIFTVRTIAIVNQKGGCGKSTTSINVAAVFASRGLRTLLVDMDPQSHCATGLGVPVPANIVSGFVGSIAIVQTENLLKGESLDCQF